MRAVILAGGQGTRLRPYTTIIPKPLVPIGGRPILEHILHGLGRSGVGTVDLCVNYLGELIRVYLTEVAGPPGLDLRFHWEEQPLGTAGALSEVPDLDETFIAMNGDILTTLDYRALVDFHRASDAALTIAMHSKRVKIELGVIENKDGLVTGYVEKPTLDYEVSMGVYVYEPRALEHLPAGPCQFPELVSLLLEAGERVAAFGSEAEWFDIGTFGEHERAQEALEQHPELFDPAPLVGDETHRAESTS
jgi:NDP-sugar pyrophosphorylase family protein